MSHVLLDRHDHIATVTLDAPERRNALTQPMVDELVATFDTIEGDEGIRTVVITGAGSAFCAGADLSDLTGAGGADAHAARATLRRIYEGFLRVSRCPLPTLAAVNGPAVGAGMNLALACDVRLAAASARFDTRFLQLGLHPGGGHTWMLERIVGPQTATALLVFGEVLSGADAAACGLAWRCVPDDELAAEARTLATRAAAVPRQVLTDVKATLAAVPTLASHERAVELELGPQVHSIAQPAAQARLAAIQARIHRS